MRSKKDKLKWGGIMAIQKKSLKGAKSGNKAKASAGNSVKSKGILRGEKTVNLKAGVLKLPAVQ
jgi:hypothetical protein